MELSETKAAESWLENFDSSEREIAKALMNEVLLISSDEFTSGINSKLDQVSEIDSSDRPKIALYAERSVRKPGGKIEAYFKGSRNGRAEGTGAAPVVVDPRNQEVGSEGIIAQLITNYCRLNQNTCFNHPGPKKLRKEKVRKIVIITDFIGSGDRITRLLESFRYVATIRSWRSYKLIRFVVITYSGIGYGLDWVRSHKLNPEVVCLMGCPTIESTVKGTQYRKTIELCNTYPKKHSLPLGYDDNGALIAFAHGIPNNAPAILHSRKGQWGPLFSSRSTVLAAKAFMALDGNEKAHKRVSQKLEISNHLKRDDWILAMHVMLSFKSGLTSSYAISANTHLLIDDVDKFITLAIDSKWLDDHKRLTSLGRLELNRLKRRRRKVSVIASGDDTFYYPKQLRAS